MLILLLHVGTAVAVLSLLAGALAWWVPFLEPANDFRPFVLAGTGILLATSLALNDGALVPITASVFLATLLLFLLPFLFAATRRKDDPPFLRVLTFNIAVTNKRYHEIANFIANANADVVLTQEVDRETAAELLPGLERRYSHVIQGGQSRDVGLALFSRHSYINGGSIERTEANPGVVWAHIRQENISYEFIGVHFADPFHAREQARHFDWLIHYIRTRARPLIVAGDFNLTPFSAKLTKFALATGLRRHATLLATWPGDKFRPVFLIDHVFSSREFYSVNVAVGPFLGSDHRPVIADVGYAA